MMVAQRTTLMSISFIAIAIARAKPNEINILWTGASIDYNQAKVGLFIIISMYLISYIMKWLGTNEITSPENVSNLGPLTRKLKFLVDNGGHYVNPKEKLNLPDKDLQKLLSDLEKGYEATEKIAAALSNRVPFHNTMAYYQHIIFTFAIPIMVPLIAIWHLMCY